MVAEGSAVRAVGRLLAYAAWTLLLIPAQAIAVALGARAASHIPLYYHRRCWPLLGLDVEIRGTPSAQRPTLFVSNHSSYLDITVLAGTLDVSFVAKREVAAWPFFGLLAKLQRSVFVDRRPRSAGTQRDEMQQRLEAGDNLVLFPEGTSNDGNRVLPFKSALFSAAERTVNGGPLAVQPVSVAYVRLDGIPLGYGLRPLVAWYGGMDLGPHLWRMAGLGVLGVVVEFHPVVSLAALGSRRALAEHCHAMVAQGVERALHGRHLEFSEPVAPRPVRSGVPLGAAIDG